MRRRLAAVVAAATLAAGVLTVAPSAVDAAPSDDEVVAFVVRGVGNGHGRGLSQWGSYGRAIAGQSWQQILNTYYGGTQTGTASEPRLRVRLTGWDGAGTVGVVSRGAKAAWKGASTTVSSAVYSSMYAVEVAANVFDVFGVTSGLGCPGVKAYTVPKVVLAQGASGQAVVQMQVLLTHFGHSPGPIDGDFGPMTAAALRAFQQASGLAVDSIWDAPDWTEADDRLVDQDPVTWQQIGNDVAGPIRFSTTVAQSTAAAGDVLGLCEPDGSLVHYRGVVEVASTTDGNRIINELDLENYLRGVVPKESPPSWGDAADGAGINALRAQSVAARSYALSQSRYSYARTCDTSSCQVYGGAAIRSGATATSIIRVEHANTDRAISETVGVVRRWPGSGAIVSTEFSASNGPRTAGGSFPSVDDPFDDQPGNPYHRWTRIIDADSLASVYGLTSVDAVHTEADPDAPFDGIWDNRVVLDDDRTVSAWDFRNAFDLPAPGFELIPIRRDLTEVGSFAFIGDSVGRSVTEVGGVTAPFRSLTEGVFAVERYDSSDSRRTEGGTIVDGVTAAGAVPVGTDLVIVELGYNDQPSEMPERIDAVMSVLRARDVGTVGWVTVSERRSSTDYDVTNDAIMAAAGRWDEMVVLDWHAVSAHGSADRWYADDVHLTATGRAEFALFLRDSVVGLFSDGYVPARRLSPGVPMRVPVTGVAGVPVSATGVALNVTAVDPSDRGWLRVWPCGSPEPDTSSVNYVAAAVEPNAVVVPVDDSGEVCVSSRASTHVVVDVSAYFVSGVGLPEGALRLLDTRADGGRWVPGDEPLRVPVTNVAGIPGSATGVALNVTAVDPLDRGWLRVWPCGAPEPGTSSVNYVAGAVEPNAVVVPVDETGQVCVTSRVPTDVVVDVSAYFVAGIGRPQGDLRLVDSRGATSALTRR